MKHGALEEILLVAGHKTRGITRLSCSQYVFNSYVYFKYFIS